MTIESWNGIHHVERFWRMVVSLWMLPAASQAGGCFDITCLAWSSIFGGSLIDVDTCILIQVLEQLTNHQHVCWWVWREARHFGVPIILGSYLADSNTHTHTHFYCGWWFWQRTACDSDAKEVLNWIPTVNKPLALIFRNSEQLKLTSIHPSPKALTHFERGCWTWEWIVC